LRQKQLSFLCGNDMGYKDDFNYKISADWRHYLWCMDAVPDHRPQKA